MVRKQPDKPQVEVFVFTLPLRSTERDKRMVAVNLKTIRQIDNATLDEFVKQLRRLRESEA